jgi:hypothetical protein
LTERDNVSLEEEKKEKRERDEGPRLGRSDKLDVLLVEEPDFLRAAQSSVTFYSSKNGKVDGSSVVAPLSSGSAEIRLGERTLTMLYTEAFKSVSVPWSLQICRN